MQKDPQLVFLGPQVLDILSKCYQHYYFDTDDCALAEQVLKKFDQLNKLAKQGEKLDRLEKLMFIEQMNRLLSLIKLKNQQYVQNLHLLKKMSPTLGIAKQCKEKRKQRILQLARESLWNCKLNLNNFYFLTLTLNSQIEALKKQGLNHQNVDKALKQLVLEIRNTCKNSLSSEFLTSFQLPLLQPTNIKALFLFSDHQFTVDMIQHLNKELGGNLFGNTKSFLQFIKNETLEKIQNQCQLQKIGKQQLIGLFQGFCAQHHLIFNSISPKTIVLPPFSLQNYSATTQQLLDLSQFYSKLQMQDQKYQILEKIPSEKLGQVKKSMLLGQVELLRNNLEKATQVAKNSLSQTQKIFGKNSKQFLQSSVFLAKTLISRGSLEQAQKALDNALEIGKTSYTENIQYSELLSQMGDIHLIKGKFQEALQQYQMSEKNVSFTSQQIVPIQLYSETLSKIAEAYIGLGKFTASLQYRKKSLELLQQSTGHYDSVYAVAINKLGNAYDELGRYDEALYCFLQAEKILRIQNRMTWSYGLAVKNIGITLFRIGRYRQSLDFFNRSLEIRKNIYGDKDVEYATIVKQKGLCFWKLGQLDKANECFELRRKIQQETVGKIHSEYANTLNFLALVCREKKKYAQALEYYFQSLQIFDKTIGLEHHKCAMTFNNIALVYFLQKKYQASLQYDLKSLKIKEEKLGSRHPSTATSYLSVGQILAKLCRFDEALNFLGKCLYYSKEIYGQRNKQVAKVYHVLGEVHEQMAKDYFQKQQAAMPEQ